MHIKGLRAFLIALPLLILTLAGCSDSDNPNKPGTESTGSIVITCVPNSLNAPWTLKRGTLGNVTGTGSQTLTDVPAAAYILTWGSVADWTSPPDSTKTLAANLTINFTGNYTPYVNPFVPASVATDSTFEVMTWNIEHFPKNGTATTANVAEIIQGLNVDLIGLQEIEDPSSFQQVISSLEGFAGFKANSSSFDINLAFIYRANGRLVKTNIYEIFANNRREFPRRPLVFEGTYDGIPLVVINNHFKCCGDNILDADDEWDEENRRRDASIMLANYVAANFSGQRVIILGDLNDSLTDISSDNVFNIFLDDTTDWLCTDLSIAEGTNNNWSFPGWPSHLDHVFIYGPLLDDFDGPLSSIQTVPILSYFPGGWNGYETNVSDHLPVCLKLDFD